MPRIDDATRMRVLELARSGLSRNKVARQTNVGTGSVSRICGEAGVTFQRSPQTREATQAKQVDQAATRMLLAGQLLDDLQDARSWLASAESARDLRDAAQAIRSLADAHARLAMVPTKDGDTAEQGKTMLNDLFGALQLAYHHQVATGDHSQDAA